MVFAAHGASEGLFQDRRVEAMAAMCKMNSYSCVQKFGKGSAPEEPSVRLEQESLAFSASQELLPHPDGIQAVQPVPQHSKAVGRNPV